MVNKQFIIFLTVNLKLGLILNLLLYLKLEILWNKVTKILQICLENFCEFYLWCIDTFEVTFYSEMTQITSKKANLSEKKVDLSSQLFSQKMKTILLSLK